MDFINLTDTGSGLAVEDHKAGRMTALANSLARWFRAPVLPLAVAVSLALTLGLVPSAKAFTLKEELIHLLSQHPQLKAGRDNIAAAVEGVNFADSLFLPSVSVTGDSGYKVIDNPARRSAGGGLGSRF